MMVMVVMMLAMPVMMIMLTVTICGHNHNRGLRIGRVTMVPSRLQKASKAGGKSCTLDWKNMFLGYEHILFQQCCFLSNSTPPCQE